MRFRITVNYNGISHDMGFTRLIEVDGSHQHGLSFHSNRSYHCPQCGRIWATWEMEQFLSDWPKQYYPYRRSCPDHALPAWSLDKPGSLITDRDDIPVLTRLLLERELLLLTEKR